MSDYKFLSDADELLTFHNFLNPLMDDEVYFMSLAARTKYLTDEQKLIYTLGGSSLMFNRKLIKSNDFKDLLKTIRLYESANGSYLTKNKMNIPNDAMTIYVNINASSGIKALKQFTDETNDLMFNVLNDKQLLSKYKTLDTLLLSCYQRQTGTKYLLDIDFDISKDDYGFSILKEFITELKKNLVTYKILETHSGYHVLIVRKTIHFNYHDLLCKFDKEVKQVNKKYEILKNINNMIPCPGTFQASFPVHFINI